MLQRRARQEAVIELVEEGVRAGTLTRDNLFFLIGMLVASVQGAHRREDAILKVQRYFKDFDYMEERNDGEYVEYNAILSILEGGPHES